MSIEDSRTDRDEDPLRLYAIIRGDLEMPPGKIAAQAGHAFLETYIKGMETDPTRIEEWRNGFKGIKITLVAKNLNHLLKAKESIEKTNFPYSLIVDLGYTLFDGKPTITCLGIGPAKKSEIGHITKKFQLLK